jgi:hypothetical protein
MSAAPLLNPWLLEARIACRAYQTLARIACSQQMLLRCLALGSIRNEFCCQTVQALTTWSAGAVVSRPTSAEREAPGNSPGSSSRLNRSICFAAAAAAAAAAVRNGQHAHEKQQLVRTPPWCTTPPPLGAEKRHCTKGSAGPAGAAQGIPSRALLLPRESLRLLFCFSGSTAGSMHRILVCFSQSGSFAAAQHVMAMASYDTSTALLAAG